MTQGLHELDELAARVAHGMLAAEGTGPAWGITIEEARADYARVSMVVRADMLNGHGFVHGGMIFALADTAFAYVCNGAQPASVAAQASIVFLDKRAKARRWSPKRPRSRARAGARSDARRGPRPRTAAPIAEFTGYSRTLGGAVVEI